MASIRSQTSLDCRATCHRGAPESALKLRGSHRSRFVEFRCPQTCKPRVGFIGLSGGGSALDGIVTFFMDLSCEAEGPDSEQPAVQPQDCLDAGALGSLGAEERPGPNLCGYTWRRTRQINLCSPVSLDRSNGRMDG